MRACNVCKKRKENSKFKHQYKKTCIRCEFRWKQSFLRLLVQDRRLTAKERIATHEPNILVVDTTDEVHVDRVESEIQRQNTIIGALKEMAQKHNIIIVAVHHVNKISAAGNTIALHSLKGSTNVVQKADKVIMVKGNRDEKARVVTSEKSRDDGKFEMTSLFDYETMTFRQVDWS